MKRIERSSVAGQKREKLESSCLLLLARFDEATKEKEIANGMPLMRRWTRVSRYFQRDRTERERDEFEVRFLEKKLGLR